MAWFSKSGAEMARQGMISEFREQQKMNIKLFIFELWKNKVKLTLNFKRILLKQKNKYLSTVFKAFDDNSRSYKARIIEWNNVSKRLKYWLFEKIYEKFNIKYESDVVTHIVEEHMKPNLKYEYFKNNYIHRSRFGQYIWKPNIFKKKLYAYKKIKCHRCPKDKAIIPFRETYYSVCYCQIIHCKECFKKHFIQEKQFIEKTRCGNLYCNKNIHSSNIYTHRSGFSSFDLSKLYFNMYWTENSLTVQIYDINKAYKDNKNIIYLIKLCLLDWGTVYNNVSIQDLARYIIFLRWYYRKIVYKEIIIFSKFYHLLNEILEYIYIEPKTILRKNHCYKNPQKTMEIFLVLDSINKYY